MQTKMIEIRDSMTTIAALAIRMIANDLKEYSFLWREGYPKDGSSIVLMRLSDQKATNDPYKWHALGMGLRTMQISHDFIINHWDEIESGDVVDVEYILNETTAPKTPEIGAYA